MKNISFITRVLLSLAIISTIFIKVPAYADSFKVVTLGADLSENEKNEMLKYFQVTRNDASVLVVTSEEEYKALGNVATASQLGNKAISCSYIEPTSNGGLNITTNNLTWVTEDMIKNALITAGVKNTNVIASAPFKVSGTAALTGILKGFENSSGGEKIDENKKEAANEEIVVTGDLGDKIGQADATNLINEIKKNIIKDSPSSDEELNTIINQAIAKYNYDLSAEEIAKIKSVMSKINDLHLDYSSLKNDLNNVSNELKDKISSEDVSGFFAKLGEFFSGLWDSIISIFS